jgi:hypothetical protein
MIKRAFGVVNISFHIHRWKWWQWLLLVILAVYKTKDCVAAVGSQTHYWRLLTETYIWHSLYCNSGQTANYEKIISYFNELLVMEKILSCRMIWSYYKVFKITWSDPISLINIQNFLAGAGALTAAAGAKITGVCTALNCAINGVYKIYILERYW